jgi:hypothetical protein
MQRMRRTAHGLTATVKNGPNATDERVTVCQGDGDRGGVLEQAEQDRRCDRAWFGAGGGCGPGDGAGVRVSVQDSDQAVVGAGGVGLDPDGAGSSAEPGFQRGGLGDDVGGRLPAVTIASHSPAAPVTVAA